jgi:molybdate transport system ATP-binding protein
VIFNGVLTFDQLSFDWKEGTHWAIVADSGTLPTAFLETIRGNALMSSGSIQRTFATDYLAEKQEEGAIHSYRDLIAYVSQKYEFQNRSNLQNFYFQQRFNSSESDQASTVRETLSEVQAKISGPWNLENVTDLLRLNSLLDKSLLKLSNGETRRLAIAAGLMRQPKIYLMDQPMTGLDSGSRAEFGIIIKGMQAKGVHLMLTTAANEIPQGITHVVRLSAHLRIQLFTREAFQKSASKTQISDYFDWALLSQLLPDKTQSSTKPVIELRDVTINYGGNKILNRISWLVNPGERWLLRGRNGSGKSTLISLLIGENPQAYSQAIWLFGRKRGTGESIWDVKRPTGFMAPELSRFFPANQTCRKVILSGLFDTMGLFRKVSIEQEDLAGHWIKLFKLEASASVLINRLSLEQQRWTLLARALIKKPELLILDEASQGMDEYQRRLFKETIQRICELSSITLIYVSHYSEDVPEGVDQIFELG